MQRDFTVVLERDSAGCYVASVPALRGCHTQAPSMDELMERLREAVKVCLESEEAEVEPLIFVGIQRISFDGLRDHSGDSESPDVRASGQPAMLPELSSQPHRGATMNDIKEEAHRLIERLPEGATWDDLMREVHVRKAVESGIADSEAGRTVPLEEVRRRFGLEL